MSPRALAAFEEWLAEYAARKGLAVLVNREALAEAFSAGLYYESRGLALWLYHGMVLPAIR